MTESLKARCSRWNDIFLNNLNNIVCSLKNGYFDTLCVQIGELFEPH